MNKHILKSEWYTFKADNKNVNALARKAFFAGAGTALTTILIATEKKEGDSTLFRNVFNTMIHEIREENK